MIRRWHEAAKLHRSLGVIRFGFSDFHRFSVASKVWAQCWWKAELMSVISATDKPVVLGYSALTWPK
jgi:hypothetical protein